MSAMPNVITAAQLRAIAGAGARSDLVAAIVRGWPAAVAKARLTTGNRAAHFLAQILTETGGLAILSESGAYRERQILKIFGAREYSKPRGGRGHSAGAIAGFINETRRQDPGTGVARRVQPGARRPGRRARTRRVAKFQAVGQCGARKRGSDHGR
jgi:predicted chitinase